MRMRNHGCIPIVSLEVKKIHPNGQNTFGLIKTTGAAEKKMPAAT
jgi:hypothetical protein